MDAENILANGVRKQPKQMATNHEMYVIPHIHPTVQHTWLIISQVSLNHKNDFDVCSLKYIFGEVDCVRKLFSTTLVNYLKKS